MNYRFEMKMCGARGVCGGRGGVRERNALAGVARARWLAACSALNADGSNLKANAPLAITPLFEATNISITPTLAARGSSGTYVTQTGASLSHRFQVSDSDSFANILATRHGRHRRVERDAMHR